MTTLRYILLLLLIFSFSSLATSQEIVVSDELSINNSSGYHIVGETQNNTYVLLERSKRFYISNFNEQLRRMWTKEIILDRRSPKIVTTTVRDSAFNVYYIFKKKSKYHLKVHNYNLNGDLQDSITLSQFNSTFFDFSYDAILSEDQSKLLIYIIENNSIFHQFCIDQNSLKLQWDKSFKPERYYNKREPFTVDLSNDGQSFFTFLRNNYPSNNKIHHYKIYHYTPTTNKLVENDFDFKGLLTVDVYSKYDNKNNKLVYAGLYGEKSKHKGDGHFYVQYDPSSQTHTLNYQLLDKAFIASFMGDKKIKKNGAIYDTETKESILRRDGGVILFLEQSRVMKRDYANNSQFRSASTLVDEYYYNNIMILSIHPNGELHWKAFLPKKQYSQNDSGAFSSYFLFKTRSKLHLLFNDEIRQNNSISHYFINGKGEYQRSSLLNTRNLNLNLRFKDALQLNTKQLLIPSEWRGQLKLVRIEY